MSVDATGSTGRAACWCGERDLRPYSPEYRVCLSCGTLVSCVGLAGDEVPVRDDETDFYGKRYWQGHQTDELGLPDIVRRARADVSERCMHWLWALLRHKHPPARVLEVGCAHGGFVALARWAGFNATGLELSPWVAEFARSTFGVPMLVGPVEGQSLADGSFDAVVLNDVLEHLPDPVGTMGSCGRLLKDDGVLLVQTPCYPEGVSFEELLARKDRFLETMESRARQHLYLFSRRAAGQLLAALGFAAVEFLPALFEYDMYFAAGRRAVPRADAEALAAALTASPQGRMKLAWLDFLAEFEAREVDRAARLGQVLRLHELLRQSQEAVEWLKGENRTLANALEAARAGAASPPPAPPPPGPRGRGPRSWLRPLRRLLRAG